MTTNTHRDQGIRACRGRVRQLLHAGPCGAGVVALALAACPALSHEQDGVEIRDVIGDVGKVSFALSCAGDNARDHFERGLALLHHMTYEVAESEFVRVAQVDPDCAMAYWGIALTLIHPVWPGQPTAAVLERGAAQLTRARGLVEDAREAAYIEALGAFYDHWVETDHATRLRRWAAAQAELAARYPDDDEALALAALLQIAAAPKDDLSFAAQREAGSKLEALRARRPRHPAGIHYLIHAYDNPPLAERALDAARAYDTIAPEVPHALHMPSHIFTRLGLWRESAKWNTRSREAARKLIVDDRIYAEFAHASDYLVYAYLQAGQDADARKARDLLFEAPPVQDNFVAAYAFAAAATRVEMELADWAGAAAIAPRRPGAITWDKYPACEAIVHYARGLGAARSRQLQSARAAVERLGWLAGQLEADPYWAQQTRIQQQIVQAWIQQAEGQTPAALAAMAAAADGEDALDKHPVTPGAVLPARELYADLLYAAGRHGEALAAYEAALQVSPNRFNSLAGAGRAAEAAGLPAQARRYFSRLVEIAGAGDTVRPGLREARRVLTAGLTSVPEPSPPAPGQPLEALAQSAARLP